MSVTGMICGTINLQSSTTKTSRPSTNIEICTLFNAKFESLLSYPKQHTATRSAIVRHDIIIRMQAYIPGQQPYRLKDQHGCGMMMDGQFRIKLGI